MKPNDWYCADCGDMVSGALSWCDCSKDEGRKDDASKLRWDLLPLGAVQYVVDVMTYGAAKYGDNNWQKLLSADGRYFAAAMRHVVAWRLGHTYDEESKLHHLAHAACCLLFMLSKSIGFDRQLDKETP